MTTSSPDQPTGTPTSAHQAGASNARRYLLILSPLLIVVVGHLTARLSQQLFGQAAWVVLGVALWAMFLFFAYLAGRTLVKRAGKRKDTLRSSRWNYLALVVGLIPLPFFLLNWHLLKEPWIIATWIGFAAINAHLEEAYWRGTVLDVVSGWPSWIAVFYSAFFFALNHPVSWGVISRANAHPITFASTFVMGIVWALVYKKTNSLRWPIISHFAVDIFNLSILVFLNIFIPPGMK